jgi:hypothetical protein
MEQIAGASSENSAAVVTVVGEVGSVSQAADVSTFQSRFESERTVLTLNRKTKKV